MMSYNLLRTNFQDLSRSEEKDLRSLTIKNSGLIRYLDGFEDGYIPSCDLLIAKGLSTIMGWSMIGDDQDSAQDGNEGVIYLFVKDDWRGAGVGIYLFEQAVNLAKDKGYKKIYVYAHDEVSKKFFASEKVNRVMARLGLLLEVVEN